MTIRNGFVVSVLAITALALLVWGQSVRGGEAAPAGAGPDSRPSRSGRGFGPGRGGRFLDDVKAQIRASDEEWKVIGPKLRNLIFLKMIVEGGVGGEGPGPFGGPPGGGPGGPPGRAFGGPGDPMPGGGPGGPMPGGGPGGPMPGGGPGGPMPGGGPGGPMPGGGPGGPMPGGGPGGPMPGGGPGGPGFGGPVSGDFILLVQARADLRTALDDPKTSPEALQEKVAVVRQARRKARAALADAGKNLLELLTADQEAVLVALGHLD